MQRSTIIMYPEKNRTPVEVAGPPGSLLVRSQFFTLQGEGPFAGRPAYFVRLAGCNLGAKQSFCQGCDTDFRLSESKFLTFQEILDAYQASLPEFYSQQRAAKVLAVEPDQPSMLTGLSPVLVITGGEPSLHEQLPEFCEAAARSCLFFQVQVESNGFDLDVLGRAQDTGAYVVISPKASSKGYVQSALVPKMDSSGPQVAFLAAASTASAPAITLIHDLACFKFVVSADPDNSHHNLPAWVTDPSRPTSFDIYVSPCTVYRRMYEGEVSSAWDPTLVDQRETQANYAYAAMLAQKYNLLLSVQVHTLTAIP